MTAPSDAYFSLSAPMAEEKLLAWLLDALQPMNPVNTKFPKNPEHFSRFSGFRVVQTAN